MSDVEGGESCFDCAIDPIGRLREMFVEVVQRERIELGQDPAERTVFRKSHGVVHGRWEPVAGLDAQLAVGVFGMGPRDAWVRFSSDTAPTDPDARATCGVGIKLFDVPGTKLLGDGDTQDFILQNSEVFFVDNAVEMCEFTQASVITGDGDRYLAAHPETKRLLEEMRVPVPSTLTATYWGVLPYSIGSGFAKYKLVPELGPDQDAGGPPPDGADYLATDLASRLRSGDYRFQFMVQLRTDPELMPLDQATVPWSEELSPPIHVATLVLPQQDVEARGQAAYGEHLAFNPWHALVEHEPHGSIAAARRVAYEASADQRRSANGIPLQEPGPARRVDVAIDDPGTEDDCIVRAVIHPAIGVARVGNSADDFFIGPEVTTPIPQPHGFYRDETGALKRQAARFRVYGVNAQGAIVRELTGDPEATIEWTVHLANHKAAWYEFQLALDIPEAASAPPSLRRNPSVADRQDLVIDPGERTIEGVDQSGAAHCFDSGRFMGEAVYLGELRTDAEGRLIVLGGRGMSRSAIGAKAVTFANNNGWCDDTSDGPVRARVHYRGGHLPVDPAWVAVAPPNYAPLQKSVRTMWDLVRDVAVTAQTLACPVRPSFQQDLRPIFERLSDLQWVNQGFAAAFGWEGPFNLSSHEWLDRLSDPGSNQREIRRVIANNFRSYDTDSWSPVPWPWLYGDAMSLPPNPTPRQHSTLTDLQLRFVDQWADGDFVDDYDPDPVPATSLDDVPVADQGDMLDRAALEFCLADAFHPGCELTWPMRTASMYMAPFRIKHAPVNWIEPDFGPLLDEGSLTLAKGPLGPQGPGGLTRWMAIPWQTDTASCRSGYSPQYDPYVPSFWPARVPNEVLSKENYDLVVDADQTMAVRMAAFANRAAWTRPLGSKSYTEEINHMIDHFGLLGVVEERPGPDDDAGFPTTMQVENLGPGAFVHMRAARAEGRATTAATSRFDLAGVEKARRFPQGLRRPE